MIGLLNYLQWKLDFKLMVINRSPDYIIQPNKPQEQKKEMLKIVKSRDATVTARQDIFIFQKRLVILQFFPPQALQITIILD